MIHRSRLSARVLVYICTRVHIPRTHTCTHKHTQAGAGVARLGVVDADRVEVSNLHRQVAHTEEAAREGELKVDSLIARMRALNSSVIYDRHAVALDQHNALDIISGYDVVLDATDNVVTRYIINDACVVADVPLVSGASIAAEGQLTVYNYSPPPSSSQPTAPRSACYRCIFPQAPRTADCRRCDEAGVLGPVPGIIGVMQALEAMKILGGVGDVLCGRMLLFDGLSMKNHVVKLRPRSERCVAHGMSANDLEAFDYMEFTGQSPREEKLGGEGVGASCAAPSPLDLLLPEQRIDPEELQALTRRGENAAGGVVLVDVRPNREYSMLRLSPSINVPMDSIDRDVDKIRRAVGLSTSSGYADPGCEKDEEEAAGECGVTPDRTLQGDRQRPQLIIVCRRGNDSQLAVRRLMEEHGIACRDLRGGLMAWKKCIDPSFPVDY